MNIAKSAYTVYQEQTQPQNLTQTQTQTKIEDMQQSLQKSSNTAPGDNSRLSKKSSSTTNQSKHFNNNPSVKSPLIF